MEKHIASTIKGIREKNKLTQEQLAEVIGRTPGYVGMLEQGRGKPSYDVMKTIVDQYDIDANLFFGRTRSDAESMGADFFRLFQYMPAAVKAQFLNYSYVDEQYSEEDEKKP